MGIKTLVGSCLLGLVFPLCGCGTVDSGVTYLPESFRQPAHKVETEQPPDVHLIVRNNVSAIFMAAALASNISLSFPVPAKRWMDYMRQSNGSRHHRQIARHRNLSGEHRTRSDQPA